MWSRQSYQECASDTHWLRRESGNEILWLQIKIEEMGKLDASEINDRRLDATGVWTSEKGEFSIFPYADGTGTLCGRDHEVRESTQRQYHPVGSEDLRGEPTEAHDDAEARNDWSIEGDFIYRHHTVPRVHVPVPQEESFPIPLKYIDVARTTHTNLDVLQGKRINDSWNVDGDRTLSDLWTGFTKFTLLSEKLPPGYVLSGRAPYKDSGNYQTCLFVA